MPKLTPAKGKTTLAKKPKSKMRKPKIVEQLDGVGLFTPQTGTLACYYDEHNDKHEDFLVKQIDANGNAVIALPSPETPKDKEWRKIVRVDQLSRPKNPPINDRFRYCEKILRLAMNGKITSTMVMGEGGLGKSYMVEKLIEDLALVDGQDFIMLKGSMSPRALFDTLSEHSHRLIILDDMDSVFKDTTSRNILKATLDTKEKRTVSWYNKTEKQSVTFYGQVIFLTNMSKNDFDSATLSRTVVNDLFMTPAEKIIRFRKIAPEIIKSQVRGTITEKIAEDIIDLLDYYKNSIHKLSARSLVKAFQIYADMEGEPEQDRMEIIQYQILNS